MGEERSYCSVCGDLSMVKVERSDYHVRWECPCGHRVGETWREKVLRKEFEIMSRLDGGPARMPIIRVGVPR